MRTIARKNEYKADRGTCSAFVDVVSIIRYRPVPGHRVFLTLGEEVETGGTSSAKTRLEILPARKRAK